MPNHQITVAEYLSNEKDKLIEVVDEIIANNKKLHISAPVGTGKTFFAMDVIEHLGENVTTLFLFPIIAISEQVKIEFKNRDIDAEIFNSKVSISDVKDCQVILSTIDSAHKLINDGFLSDSKVLIILDETHTYLQKARENFSKSVEAILKSGYPIIGFSATPSVWVNHYLFNIQEYFEVKVTSYKPKKINPIEVKAGLKRYVADQVCKSQNDKWIIFLERIKDQDDLKLLIKQQRPNTKVAILNANTKKGSEKKTWKYLMKNGKLPDKVEVAIINSVAQAGINLKNTDIDNVILVGKHDTYGIAQFLGRCRAYTGEFDFYFSPGGRKLKQQINANYIQNRIKLINSILHYKTVDYHNELMSLLPMLDGTFAIDEDGALVANKCMVATKAFSLLRDAPGGQIVNDLSVIYPKDIIVKPIRQVAGISGSTAAQNKLRLDNSRKKLVELLAKHSPLVLSLTGYINSESDYEDAYELIKNPNRNLFKAIVENKPFFEEAKDRSTLKKIVKLAKKSNRSIPRVATASELFIQSGHKKSVLKKYIRTSDSAIKHLYAAKELFENKNTSVYILDDTMAQLEGLIGQVKSTNDWKSNVRTLLGIAKESDQLVDTIFNSCLQLKNKDAYPQGKRVTHRELIGVNKSIEDYLDFKGTLMEFINPDS